MKVVSGESSPLKIKDRELPSRGRRAFSHLPFEITLLKSWDFSDVARPFSFGADLFGARERPIS